MRRPNPGCVRREFASWDQWLTANRPPRVFQCADDIALVRDVFGQLFRALSRICGDKALVVPALIIGSSGEPGGVGCEKEAK